MDFKDKDDILVLTAKKTLVVFAVLLTIGLALYFLYLVRAVIFDFIAALIVAAALEPLVRYLQKHRLSKTWSALLALLATAVILAGLFSLIASPLVSQGVKLVENAPQIVSQITSSPKLSTLNQKYHLTDRVRNLSSQTFSKLAGAPAWGVFGKVLGGLSSFLIIIIFAFFLLVDGPRAWSRLLETVKPGQRERVNRLGHKMTKAVSGFVSGNLFISLIAGAITLITLLIFRVPYPFALAALVALFDLIPLVGAALATIVVGLVALTKGFLVAIVIVILLLIYQVVEGHIIQPIVYSRSVSLSALLVIIASVIGAELGGIIGVLLAIPAAAVIQILLYEFIFKNNTT